MKKAIVGSKVEIKRNSEFFVGDEGVGVIKAILRDSYVDLFKRKYHTDYAIQFKHEWCHYRRKDFNVL